MRNFIRIAGRLKRIERVRRDGKGYYIEKGTNIFGPPEKYYLTEKETIKYEKVKKYNQSYKNRQDAINEAKKEGRFKTVNQIIKKQNGETGIISYEYYDKNGNII